MDKWTRKNRPLCLERRFEFTSYEKTRDFLDRLGSLSENINRFPDISFGKTYVNITIRPEDDDASDITKIDEDFADKIDLLVD